ncbi:elongation factor Ts, mitochondrial isoform X1 [Coffea arabica]|uniref:Elongation factor Ts, mitochondrial n=2 Tax=Coffea arabica TaxID=13443 RepID=A0ABM4UCV5_COFAR
MAFVRGLKRPIEIFCKRRMNTPVHSGLGYSAMACKGAYFADFRENKCPFGCNCANAFCSHCISARRYSTEVSPSEQMNLIKQLRERTSAPIKEVKSALVDSNWHIESAQKELRKRGIVLASKKASRTAAEGLLALAQNDRKAAVIELNCETDFVARNEIFQYLALSLAKVALLVDGTWQPSGALHVGPELFEELKINFHHPKLSGERTVQNAITEVAAMMGENVKLRRGFAMSAPSYGILSTYLHTSPQPGVGRIAGLLSLEVEDQNASVDALQHVGSELAMHVVAAKPLFLTKDDVSTEAMESEREILKSQAESTGKPQMAVEKMVEGRLRKYFEEVVLMEQKFIVNDTLNVKTLLNNLSKEVGSPVKVGSFLRVEVGEGLQRLESSNAGEPLAQAA